MAEFPVATSGTAATTTALFGLLGIDGNAGGRDKEQR